ncbi:helix-turn-helix transcriptional regulator [Pontibacter rugosus]|uniref:Helix-turn-helix transcriptional regulator n=1 Tax=Pontibacter rugosus TaxID=1745966 RepID=A0ABW3SMZ7_9BACT
MQIQLDKTTLPANDQQVRFRKVGESDWKEGVFIGEEENIFVDSLEGAGNPVGVWDVEEWEPLEQELTEGEKLRRHREKQGLTQAQYAAQVGFSRDATISDYELNRKPLPGFMKRIMQLEKEVEALRKGRTR